MAVAKAVPIEVVIKALKSDDSSLASFGTLISFAKLYMDAFVSIFFFPHTQRLGNSIAHNLAKHARHVSGYLVWIEDIPS